MLTLSLALVRAFLIPPDVPSRDGYTQLFHTSTPDLHMDHSGAVVKRRSIMNIDRTFLDVKSPPGSIGGLYLSSKRSLDRTFCPSKTNPLQHLPRPFRQRRALLFYVKNVSSLTLTV